MTFFTMQQAIDTFNAMPQGHNHFETPAYAFSMVLNFRMSDAERVLVDALWKDGLDAMTMATGQSDPILRDAPELDPIDFVSRFQALPYGPGQYLRAAFGLWAALALLHRASTIRIGDENGEGIAMVAVYMTYAREMVNHGMLALIAARGEEDAA